MEADEHIIDYLDKYKVYITNKINKDNAKNEIEEYLNKDKSAQISETLEELINTGIDNRVSSSIITQAKTQLQLLRDRWKEIDFSTLICPTKVDTCINNIKQPPIFEESNNIHESFKFYEIDLNNNNVAYYNKHSSSLLCMDKLGNVFSKYIDNNFNTVPEDCIFRKKLIFKGDALDACNICGSITKQSIISKLGKIKSEKILLDDLTTQDFGDKYIQNNNVLVNANSDMLYKTDVLSKIAIKKKLSSDKSFHINHDDLLPQIIIKPDNAQTNIYRYINIGFNGSNVANEIKSINTDYLWKQTKEYNISNINSLYEFKKNSTDKYLTEFKDRFSKFRFNSFKVMKSSDNNIINVLVIKGYNLDSKSEPININYLCRSLDYKDNVFTDGLITGSFYILDTLSMFDLYNINKNDKLIVNVKTSNDNEDKNYTHSNLSYYNIINNSITLLFKSNIPKKEIIKTITKKKSMGDVINNKLVKQRYAWKPKQTGGDNSSNILYILEDMSYTLNNKSNFADYNSSPYINYYNEDTSSSNEAIKYNNINFTDSDIYFKYIKCDRGWCKSYNSMYNKYLFTESTFDTVLTSAALSSYSVSWINNKYMFNNQNSWKQDDSIEDTMHYKNMVAWSFEETYVDNRTTEHTNIIMKTSIPTTIKSIIKNDEIKHSFKTNQSYFIQNNLHLQSTVIYSDYNYNTISNTDILFTLYHVNKKFDDVKSNVLENDSYNSLIDIYNNDKNIKNTLYSKSKYNYNKYIKDGYQDIDIILTTDNYAINQYKNTIYKEQNKWFFEPELTVNEGYRIKNKQNEYLLGGNVILQFIKQSGNNNNLYLIKKSNSNEYMYSYNINEMTDVIKIGFNKPRSFNKSYLFSIKSDISKVSYPLYNSVLRKDFNEGDYIIKPYLYENKSLISDIYQNNITYDLINSISSYKLEFIKLSSKLKPIYKLSDKLINFNIIIDYIPFYSNNYSTYIIRNYSKPSDLLTIQTERGKQIVKWITLSKEELLNNNITRLQLSLWNFKLIKQKMLGGKYKKKEKAEPTDSCCIQ